ncbi:type VII secretion protein EccB [Mycolicibacterium vinylchloridicum]|uniref:type VII secretion protein EccB n=1 Tax=Mycolicibacterium vinylchloridicum TaxID=2736928 RepID=UPI0015CB7571|nr:type VII secretion protein EccB [Mycolicibacterium vinylchloridicum]
MTDSKRRSGHGLGLSTRTQVSGHQFLGRRTALALTRWRVRMEVEPNRRQSLAVVASVSAAAVICLGALLWSFISPAGRVGDAAIVADRDTGALYVRVGKTFYPALNLASARLIAGSPGNPQMVRPAEIEKQPQGPLVGIPGAPSDLRPRIPTSSSWLICDSVTPTPGSAESSPVLVTVINGTPDLTDRRKVLTPADTALLRYGPDTWVVRDGHRSRVDAANRAVLLPLGLSPEQISQAPPMSQALFNVLPVGRELTVPLIPEAGAPARFPGAPGAVGTVFVTPQISGPQQFSVVLADGVQTISPIVAQILQNTRDETGGQQIVVPPSTLTTLPIVDGLDLSAYPPEPLTVLEPTEHPSTCWWWQRTVGENRARVSLVAGPSLPIPHGEVERVVSLVKTNTSGSAADHVYYGPDHANFVSATGNQPDAQSADSLWWLSGSGVRFGVDNHDDARNALGLTTQPSPAPWAALRLLPPGPTLSRSDALVRYDTLPMSTDPAALEVPR